MAKAKARRISIHPKQKAFVIRVKKSDAAGVAKILKALRAPSATARAGVSAVKETRAATRFFNDVHRSLCESNQAESKVIVIDIE